LRSTSYHVADQLRGEKAERYAVAAITISRVDSLRTGDRADQRQSVAGVIKRAGPAVFDVETGRRPERGEPLRQNACLFGDQSIARIALDNFVAILAADDDPTRAGRSGIEIVLAVFPD
jgi:hypothetical protein